MVTFNDIVSYCSGLSVIVGLVVLLVRPIREKVTRVKERTAAEKNMIDEVKKEIVAVKDDVAGVKEDVKLVHEEIDNVRADSKEDKAERSRTQILRFADEIYQGVRHSKEHFDEINECITFYNQYCEEHPLFKNNRTFQAQKRIDTVYQHCMETHSFLDQND